MSEQKKINIDPGLFDFSGGKTRKKKTGEKKEGIKIKQPSQKKKNETLKKKSILKMNDKVLVECTYLGNSCKYKLNKIIKKL